MAESEVAATPTATAKKTKSVKPKKAVKAPSHPKVADMVDIAIWKLKERGGSSLHAIKKYIASNYKVDADKLAPLIKRHLKNSVASGKLLQTKGKGASGSFKTAPLKPQYPPKAKKSAKPKTPKKAAVVKKPKVKSANSPKKSKAVKPKAPKPKKAKVVKKPATKK